MPKKSSKYTAQAFKKDLSELESLISDFKGGASMSGGKKAKKSTAKKVKRSTVKKDTRKFTIVEVNGKKIAGGEGSYTGKTHAQAARKACGRACKKRKTQKLQFSLRETTQGSDKEVKKYRCQKSKLKKPVTIKYKTGQVLTITHEHIVSEMSK